MLKRFVLLFLALSCVPALLASSYYLQRLDDVAAVYVTPSASSVYGDGTGDDTSALQQAIDKVAETRREGIVFLASGRYRLTRTIHIWPGIRLIGYGATRPVLL